MKKLMQKLKKLGEKVQEKLTGLWLNARAVTANNSGELATGTLGAIIVSVVVIGLLAAAVNRFFPTFFDTMFGQIVDKLNANW